MSDARLTKKQVAIHEAGHAIVAIATGCIVGRVVLIEEKAKRGRPTGWSGRADIAQIHTDCPLTSGLIAWAGSTAVGVDWIGEDDAEPFKRFGFSSASIVTLRLLADQLTKRFRPAIKAVAQELERRGEMPGLTVKRVAFRACPSLRREAVPVARGALRRCKEAGVM